MKGLGALGEVVCMICVAVSMISVLIPQKRTRRVMSFVIGLFFVGSLLQGLSVSLGQIYAELPKQEKITVPRYSDKDYNDAVGQQTADILTESLNELLSNEGIEVRDINITLKISEQGRITVSRVVIYMNEPFADRAGDVKSIIYRNVSKEPEIYVEGKRIE